MAFSKEDLQNPHYTWDLNGNHSAYTGKPSRRLFDRDNGDQVLFLINSYESELNTFTINEVRQIENMIMNELPIGSKSEISVFNWLKEAFKPALQQVN